MTRSRCRGQRGSALILGLVLVTVALLLTTVVTIRATLSAQHVVRKERQLLAFNAAEAGVAEAIQRLRFDPWMSDVEGRLGKAEWSVGISHDMTDVEFHDVTLTSEAVVLEQRRRLRVRVRVWPSIDVAQPAAIALIDWVALP